MKRMIMQGWGGNLMVFNGVRCELVNLTFVPTSTTTSPRSKFNRHATPTAATPFDSVLYGGLGTCFPSAYANHRCMAMYKNRIYLELNTAVGVASNYYLGRWDGSGIFKHAGNYTTYPNRCGRGFELITPSGIGLKAAQDLCFLQHNGHLFIVGAFNGTNNAADAAYKTMGWDWKSATAYTANARNYRPLSISPKNKKVGHKHVAFAPAAAYLPHLNGCDAISFDSDIYFANWIDVVRFPGGSGLAQLMNPVAGLPPTSRSFAIWPANGYSNGVAVGSRKLYMLTGSGLLHQVNTDSTTMTPITDLSSFGSGWNSRTTDNWLARIASDTDEPGRSCLLMNHNNMLHAFAITATSGYKYFTCTGSPSGTTNWIDRTDYLPMQIRECDGNVFGCIDEHNNKLYIAHISMGKVGIYGHEGCHTSAGATSIYLQKSPTSWDTIVETMTGPPMRGLVMYNPNGPHVYCASGNNPRVYKSSDYAIIDYTLYDHYSRNVDVSIEYSIDRKLTWHTARRFKSYSTGSALGSATKNLPTSPIGVNYSFYWDYVNDVGFNTSNMVDIRIQPILTR